MGIIHALLYLLLGVLAPGSGRRRADAPPAAPPAIRRTGEAAPGLRERCGPAREGAARPRSPYGLTDTFVWQDTPLIRPYLAAYERQEERAARQRWRRLSLVMAADFGLDLDTRDVHATGAAW